MNSIIALNSTSGICLCPTSYYGTAMKICPSFALNLALKEGATVHTSCVFYDQQMVLVVWVQFDNDGNNSKDTFFRMIITPSISQFPFPEPFIQSIFISFTLSPSSHSWRIIDKQRGNSIQMAGRTTGQVELSKRWAIRPPLGLNWEAAKSCRTRRATRRTLQWVLWLPAESH